MESAETPQSIKEGSNETIISRPYERTSCITGMCHYYIIAAVSVHPSSKLQSCKVDLVV